MPTVRDAGNLRTFASFAGALRFRVTMVSPFSGRNTRANGRFPLRFGT
jgi:hypothetical protein